MLAEPSEPRRKTFGDFEQLYGHGAGAISLDKTASILPIFNMPAQANPESVKELRDFGRKLAEKRMEAQITRQAFAKKCGISYKHYFNIENGVQLPSLPTYISICRALEIKIPMVG